MVLFSDGEDTRVQVGDKTLDEILQDSIDNKIPVYMVRTNYERERGKVIPDEIWIPAIEKTGGRFYAADNEDALLAAIATSTRWRPEPLRPVSTPASGPASRSSRWRPRPAGLEPRRSSCAAPVPETALGGDR